MREVIFSNSNFVFFMYSGTGVNDTPFESLEVAKRKLSDNTKKLVNVYMKEILDRYDDCLKDIHIELEVEDDTGRHYEISND